MGNWFSLSWVFDIYDDISRKRKAVRQTHQNDDENEEPVTKRFEIILKKNLSLHRVISEFIFRFRYDNNCAISLHLHTEPDVVLLAFGRRWPCNRSVLSQSNFFQTLFNGCFKESTLNEIELNTHDEFINENSFQKLLEVMYRRKIDFVSNDIFNIVVTAQYFQMNEIVDFCETQLGGMVKSSNAIDFYHFADRYFLVETKQKVFEWMLLRLFPVKFWDQLNNLTIDLAEKLISDHRLVSQNEMYLYFVLKILIQIQLNGTCLHENEPFYKKIEMNDLAFLSTNEGKKFRTVFQSLKLCNILVRRENVEVLINDNIFPRSAIDSCIFENWMSLISIESPENFGPTFELVEKDEFERHAMRFSKMIYAPDFHSWKFIGFSFAFDLAMSFDGRTIIIKRVNQINEHKVSHSHLLRRLMMRWDICEMNSTVVKRQGEIQTFTMTTNEEICLKQLKKEPNYPCRISIEVLFHVPYKATKADNNLNHMYANDQIEFDQDQSTGNFIKTSIRARAFKSYKKFLN